MGIRKPKRSNHGNIKRYSETEEVRTENRKHKKSKKEQSMGKTLIFEHDHDIPDLMIKAERSEEFHAAAKELSAFIRSLPLSQADNEKLIQLTIDNVCLAERSAFEQGIRLTRTVYGNDTTNLE